MPIKTLNINTNNLFSSMNTNKMNQFRDEPPTSPTFSVSSSFSWIAERSSSEIKNIFKSTFQSLIEKERDLNLAAEVGKSLLECNTLLKEKYRTLQTEFQTRQQEANKHFQHRLANNEQTITALEIQHAELLKKYEATLEFKEKISRQNASCQQKLSAQVNELYQSLERAHEKIQEQEGVSYRSQDCRNIDKEGRISAAAAVTDDDESSVAFELSTKIDLMMNQHQQLFHAKDQMQHQFQDALVQLHLLKSQLNQARDTKEQQLNVLENKLQYQENHIQQLTCLIEEYRSDLSFSQQRMPPSLIFSAVHNASSSEDEEDEFDALPQHIQGTTGTLFSELHHAFQKEQQQETHFEKQSSHLHEPATTLVLASPVTKRRYRKRKSITATSRRGSSINQQVQQYNLYPALKKDNSLIAPMGIYRNKYHHCVSVLQQSMMHRRNFSQSIIWLPVDAFELIWRLFRFIIVVQLAMLIHLFTRIKK